MGQWGPPHSVPSLAIHSVLLRTWQGAVVQQGPRAFGRAPTCTSRRPGHGGGAGPAGRVPRRQGASGQHLRGGQAQLPDGRILVAGGNLAYPSTTASRRRGAASVARSGSSPNDARPGSGCGARTASLGHGLGPVPDAHDALGRTRGDRGRLGRERLSARRPREVEVFTLAQPDGRDRLDTVRSLPRGEPLPAHVPPAEDHPRGPGRGGPCFARPARARATPSCCTPRTGAGTRWPAGPAGRGSGDRGAGARRPERPARISLIGGSGGDRTETTEAPRCSTTPAGLSSLPVWRQGPSLHRARPLQHRAAARRLGAVGRRRPGQAPDGNLYADPVYEAELSDPATGDWREVAKEDDARTYHSTAVLLPDGRVSSAGDDRGEHAPGRCPDRPGLLAALPLPGREPACRDRGAERRRIRGAAADRGERPVGGREGRAMRPAAVTHAVEHGAALHRARPASRRARSCSPPARPQRRPSRLVHAVRARLPGRTPEARWIRSIPRRPRSRRPRRRPRARPRAAGVGSLDRRAAAARRGCVRPFADVPSRLG